MRDTEGGGGGDGVRPLSRVKMRVFPLFLDSPSLFRLLGKPPKRRISGEFSGPVGAEHQSRYVCVKISCSAQM